MELLVHLGEGNSKLKPVCLDTPSTGMQSLCFDSTVRTAIQQHVVEHVEHNKAQ